MGSWNKCDVSTTDYRSTQVTYIFILVDSLLHLQTALTSRHQLLKHLGEIFRHLLESALDGFILACIKSGDQICDALAGGV